MTAALPDLSNEIYLYTQALNNQGESEYWCARSHNTNIDLVTSNDINLSTIRNLIDKIQTTGRNWSIIEKNTSCRANWKGDCIITLRPLTLDTANRVSPVLLIFNLLHSPQSLITLAYSGISTHMQREFSQDDQRKIKTFLSKLSHWPRWILFLHFIIFSNITEND